VGLYDLAGARLVRRQALHVDIAGETTVLPELAGVRAADVLLLNDEDHTYAKLRLDDRSVATVVGHIDGFDSSLARGLCWATIWDMVYDAELPAHQFIEHVSTFLPSETDINVITATLAQAETALAAFVDEPWQAIGWGVLASTARKTVEAAPPGSGFQLAWARTFASAARTDEELAVLRRWLDGLDAPPGLSPVGDFRWHLIAALSAAGGIGVERVEAEHAADTTTAGDREATMSMALRPTAEAKAVAWAELTGPAEIPNWRRRALLQGLHHPSQVALTQPYMKRFFDEVAEVWAEQDSAQAREFVLLGYPRFHVSSDAVSLADEWLAEMSHPAPLRRLVSEGRDTVVRSLAARCHDRASFS